MGVVPRGSHQDDAWHVDGIKVHNLSRQIKINQVEAKMKEATVHSGSHHQRFRVLVAIHKSLAIGLPWDLEQGVDLKHDYMSFTSDTQKNH